MTTIIQILLSFFITLNTSNPSLSVDFTSQALLLHESLASVRYRLENGLQKVDQRLDSLEKQPHPDQASILDQKERRNSLERRIKDMKKADESVAEYLSSQAQEEENTDQIRPEIRENTAVGEVRLPQGGAKSGLSFDRACPAAAVDWIPSESEFMEWPARGSISAGTWYYPSGEVHLGVDIALNLYSPVRAPADGVILYASAQESSVGGYLNSKAGWPIGAGNSILMLASVEEQMYMVSFYHLSNRIQVRPGQTVRQSDLLAYSGNSGNSSGPHLHVEVFRIDSDWQDAVTYFQNTVDFSFETNWHSPAACSDYGCRVRPERVFEDDE